MGRMQGSVATAGTAEVAVESTTYTEQAAGAQRSLKSASASDAAAGTGVRTVRVRFFTLDSSGKMKGPYEEIVTLTGTVAAPMVATAAALIERIEALTVGSGGVAAGVISLYANNDGTGTVIASIAAGDRQTNLAHHYVPSGYQCEITDAILEGGDPAAALFRLRSLDYSVTGAAERDLVGAIPASSSPPPPLTFAPQSARPLVVGPARVRAYVTPANGNAQTSRASIGFKDTCVDLTITR